MDVLEQEQERPVRGERLEEPPDRPLCVPARLGLLREPGHPQHLLGDRLPVRVIRERGADPDHNDIDQRAQAVQVGEAGRAIDVVRRACGGRDPGVDRLTELADNDESVGGSLPEWPKDFLPGCGEGPVRLAEHSRNVGPSGIVLGKINHHSRFGSSFPISKFIVWVLSYRLG